MNNREVESLLLPCFPMLLTVSHFKGKEELNSELSEYILDEEKRLRDDAKKTSTQGGFHTDAEFINRDEPLIKEFLSTILAPSIQEHMAGTYARMGDGFNPPALDKLSFRGWGNVMRKGEWNAPHNHLTPHNRVSAVYYLKTDPCSDMKGALQIDNPNQVSIYHGSHGNIKIPAKEGSLVIFPSYLMHFSHPFEKEGERILIASDVSVDDKYDVIGDNRFKSLVVRPGGA